MLTLGEMRPVLRPARIEGAAIVATRTGRRSAPVVSVVRARRRTWIDTLFLARRAIASINPSIVMARGAMRTWALRITRASAGLAARVKATIGTGVAAGAGGANLTTVTSVTTSRVVTSVVARARSSVLARILAGRSELPLRGLVAQPERLFALGPFSLRLGQRGALARGGKAAHRRATWS
ncbi:hypothetical protein [Sphaerotilus mobilis]|uniref:hypothetical protein n=1 Tax=Sphaerotilus mobilis TaxID=47994 RepID=UPI001F5F5976|nr:hypothetical protein [Sphaerotilus mobilis]